MHHVHMCIFHGTQYSTPRKYQGPLLFLVCGSFLSKNTFTLLNLQLMPHMDKANTEMFANVLKGKTEISHLLKYSVVAITASFNYVISETFSPLSESFSCFNVSFTVRPLRSVECYSDGWPSGSLFHPHTASLELSQSHHWVLGKSLDPSPQITQFCQATGSRKVVSNIFHSTIMEAYVALGNLQCSKKKILKNSPDLWLGLRDQ